MRLFDHILEELDWPAIYLVSPEQFYKIEGWNPLTTDVWGGQGEISPTITVVGKPSAKMRRNIIYHEIFHHLFPNKPHWWVELAAERMAKGGGKGEYTKISGHTLDDVPSREVIVKLAKRASKRFNGG
jgi:hypothetical protein